MYTHKCKNLISDWSKKQEEQGFCYIGNVQSRQDIKQFDGASASISIESVYKYGPTVAAIRVAMFLSDTYVIW